MYLIFERLSEIEAKWKKSILPLVGPLRILEGEACALCRVCKGPFAQWSKEMECVIRCGSHGSCYQTIKLALLPDSRRHA